MQIDKLYLPLVLISTFCCVMVDRASAATSDAVALHVFAMTNLRSQVTNLATAIPTETQFETAFSAELFYPTPMDMETIFADMPIRPHFSEFVWEHKISRFIISYEVAASASYMMGEVAGGISACKRGTCSVLPMLYTRFVEGYTTTALVPLIQDEAVVGDFSAIDANPVLIEIGQLENVTSVAFMSGYEGPDNIVDLWVERAYDGSLVFPETACGAAPGVIDAAFPCLPGGMGNYPSQEPNPSVVSAILFTMLAAYDSLPLSAGLAASNVAQAVGAEEGSMGSDPPIPPTNVEVATAYIVWGVAFCSSLLLIIDPFVRISRKRAGPIPCQHQLDCVKGLKSLLLLIIVVATIIPIILLRRKSKDVEDWSETGAFTRSGSHPLCTPNAFGIGTGYCVNLFSASAIVISRRIDYDGKDGLTDGLIVVCVFTFLVYVLVLVSLLYDPGATARIENEIAALNGANTQNQNEIAALNGANTKNQNEIAALDGANTQNQKEIAALNGANTKNQNEISSLRTRSTQHEQDIESLKRRAHRTSRIP